MTRNQALVRAEAAGVDYVVMIDSDMHPDVLNPHENKWVKPFWGSSWEYMLENRCGMIAAPYCGPPPEECVYVFRWNTQQDQRPNPNMRLEMYDRDTASKMRGIQRAAALATGLCIINMKAVLELKKRPGPWFDYEWKDRNGAAEVKCEHCLSPIPGERVDKGSTEDVFFSRNLDYAGWPIYCNWDAWAGHYKLKLVGPPQMVPQNSFPQMMRRWADDLPAAKIPNPYPDKVPAADVDTTACDTVPLAVAERSALPAGV
jgi:hypothetical protein